MGLVGYIGGSGEWDWAEAKGRQAAGSVNPIFHCQLGSIWVTNVNEMSTNNMKCIWPTRRFCVGDPLHWLVLGFCLGGNTHFMFRMGGNTNFSVIR